MKFACSISCNFRCNFTRNPPGDFTCNFTCNFGVSPPLRPTPQTTNQMHIFGRNIPTASGLTTLHCALTYYPPWMGGRGGTHAVTDSAPPLLVQTIRFTHRFRRGPKNYKKFHTRLPLWNKLFQTIIAEIKFLSRRNLKQKGLNSSTVTFSREQSLDVVTAAGRIIIQNIATP